MRKSAILKNRDNVGAGVSPKPVLAAVASAPKPFLPVSSGAPVRAPVERAAAAGAPAPLKKAKKEEDERADKAESVAELAPAGEAPGAVAPKEDASEARTEPPAAKKPAPLKKTDRATAESAIQKRRKLLAISYKKGPSRTLARRFFLCLTVLRRQGRAQGVAGRGQGEPGAGGRSAVLSVHVHEAQHQEAQGV